VASGASGQWCGKVSPRGDLQWGAGSGQCGNAHGMSRSLRDGVVQRSRRHSLHGAGIRCDFPRWLVLCRMEAVLVGWRGSNGSHMPVTSLVSHRSPTCGGLLRFLATPCHSMAGLGLGHGGFRAKALQGLWLWPTMVSPLFKKALSAKRAVTHRLELKRA
jgi:hypothetical protein